MAISRELVAPDHTAIVTNECQRLTVGDMSMLPELVASAAQPMRELGRLVRGGRPAGVQVIHCVVKGRPDGKGGNSNTRMHAVARKRQAAGQGGTRVDLDQAAEVAADVGSEPDDIVLTRIHAMSPMTDTGLDSILRNLKVSTIVAAGVSINVGLTNLVMDAVNRGYDVVVPRECSAGVPPEYGEMVLENSIAMIARLTTVDELLALWSTTSMASA
jgi:biuret amidohydrolase